MSKHSKKNIDLPLWVEFEPSESNPGARFYSVYRADGQYVSGSYLDGETGKHRAPESE